MVLKGNILYISVNEHSRTSITFAVNLPKSFQAADATYSALVSTSDGGNSLSAESTKAPCKWTVLWFDIIPGAEFFSSYLPQSIVDYPT